MNKNEIDFVSFTCDCDWCGTNKCEAYKNWLTTDQAEYIKKQEEIPNDEEGQ